MAVGVKVGGLEEGRKCGCRVEMEGGGGRHGPQPNKLLMNMELPDVVLLVVLLLLLPSPESCVCVTSTRSQARTCDSCESRTCLLAVIAAAGCNERNSICQQLLH